MRQNKSGFSDLTDKQRADQNIYKCLESQTVQEPCCAPLVTEQTKRIFEMQLGYKKINSIFLTAFSVKIIFHSCAI